MKVMDRKKIILLIAGAAFILAGIYYRSIAYAYIGIGTWLSGMIYCMLFQKYKEITSFLLGLVILHAGVILLLIEKISNPKLLGFLVFTSGVVVVLSSGFSDDMRRKR